MIIFNNQSKVVLWEFFKSFYIQLVPISAFGFNIAMQQWISPFNCTVFEQKKAKKPNKHFKKTSCMLVYCETSF